MNQRLKANKQTIREFMYEHYTDERLVMLLAHAQSGRLTFHSCCCFIGIATADHALRSDGWDADGSSIHNSHIATARQLPGAARAEQAFLSLGYRREDEDFGPMMEARRRVRRLIPIIKAEIRRRDRERQAITVAADAYELTL